MELSKVERMDYIEQDAHQDGKNMDRKLETLVIQGPIHMVEQKQESWR